MEEQAEGYDPADRGEAGYEEGEGAAGGEEGGGGEGYEYEEPYDEGYAFATVRALYDYTANAEDQLTFTVGTEITLLEEFEGGWWKGELNGKEGIFPADYVDYVTQEGDAAAGHDDQGNGEDMGPDDGKELDASGGGAGGEEDDARNAADEKKERRKKAEEELEAMERQIEEERMAKAELERELEQLRLVKKHTQQALEDMSTVRSDATILSLDSMKLLYELDGETESMDELEAARQTLQAELNNFNDHLSKEVKKGSLVEQFKPDILRKLTQLTLKLADDDMFTGIYEKKKNEFYYTLKQITDKTKAK